MLKSDRAGFFGKILVHWIMGQMGHFWAQSIHVCLFLKVCSLDFYNVLHEVRGSILYHQVLFEIMLYRLYKKLLFDLKRAKWGIFGTQNRFFCFYFRNYSFVVVFAKKNLSEQKKLESGICLKNSFNFDTLIHLY